MTLATQPAAGAGPLDLSRVVRGALRAWRRIRPGGSAFGDEGWTQMITSKTANPFVGRWRITEMELWDRKDLDLVAPAFIEFDRDGKGEFQFIAVQGCLDCRFSERGGMPAVEFSWEGQDEGDESLGRGWAILCDGKLEGRWFFHRGDDSWFLATKLSRSATKGRSVRRSPARQPNRG